jgi:hypothetical protein
MGGVNEVQAPGGIEGRAERRLDVVFHVTDPGAYDDDVEEFDKDNQLKNLIENDDEEDGGE